MKKTVLVTGGAGFIGSHVNQMLSLSGYSTIILDNLSLGSASCVTNGLFIQGDISDEALLNKIFTSHQIDAVMHFAAFTDVGESMHHPQLYFKNNVSNTLTLLTTMMKHSVKILIFSSSAAVYGIPQTNEISEIHPRKPINPYGQSKFMVEEFLEQFDRAYGLRFYSLRYFNAAGGDPNRKIKYCTRKESNLIPLLLNRILSSNYSITINGNDYATADGTCIRDFVHIEDLGRAHILSMEQLFQGSPSKYFNLGNGKGFSVKEVIQAIEKITGKNISVTLGSRRPGDPAKLIADASKAKKELHWSPKLSLEEMVSHAWEARR